MKFCQQIIKKQLLKSNISKKCTKILKIKVFYINKRLLSFKKIIKNIILLLVIAKIKSNALNKKFLIYSSVHHKKINYRNFEMIFLK